MWDRVDIDSPCEIRKHIPNVMSGWHIPHLRLENIYPICHWVRHKPYVRLETYTWHHECDLYKSWSNHIKNSYQSSLINHIADCLCPYILTYVIRTTFVLYIYLLTFKCIYFILTFKCIYFISPITHCTIVSTSF